MDVFRSHLRLNRLGRNLLVLGENRKEMEKG